MVELSKLVLREGEGSWEKVNHPDSGERAQEFVYIECPVFKHGSYL